jgi:hypothetical protein
LCNGHGAYSWEPFSALPNLVLGTSVVLGYPVQNFLHNADATTVPDFSIHQGTQVDQTGASLQLILQSKARGVVLYSVETDSSLGVRGNNRSYRCSTTVKQVEVYIVVGYV